MRKAKTKKERRVWRERKKEEKVRKGEGRRGEERREEESGEMMKMIREEGKKDKWRKKVLKCECWLRF